MNLLFSTDERPEGVKKTTIATLTTVSLQVIRHYNRLSLNGYLYKTDTSVKLTPKVLPAHLSKTAAHLVPDPKVFVLERVDCI